jgi:DNA replication protein DnaC
MKKLSKLADQIERMKKDDTIFHRMAAKKRAENPDYKPEKKLEDDLYYTDEKGRLIANRDVQLKVIESDNEQNAVFKHGNDKNKRLDLCGFPKKDRTFMFDYDYKSVLNNFQDLDIKNSDWMFIYGSQGTGKTTLAMRLVWEYMKPAPARYSSFLSVRDWVQEQYRLFKNDRDNEIPDLPKLKRYIILDDFDKIHFTEWQMLQIFRLIDYLDRNNKKVIITSNHSLSELLEKSNENINYKAVLDRIAGRTKKAILRMDGKSYRNENVQF